MVSWWWGSAVTAAGVLACVVSRAYRARTRRVLAARQAAVERAELQFARWAQDDLKRAARAGR